MEGYSDAALEGCMHHVRIVGSPQRAHKRFPHIHKVFGNLKTWLNGTHHGVEPKYRPSYLAEFFSASIVAKAPWPRFRRCWGFLSRKSR
jgi:ISXO2-like transposase domain